MREYNVITDYSLEHLIQSISHFMNEGWQLAGGISTVLYVKEEFDTILYSQAIFK